MFSLVTAQGSVKDVTAFLAVQVVLVEWWYGSSTHFVLDPFFIDFHEANLA
jgi:hypothetical protein